MQSLTVLERAFTLQFNNLTVSKLEVDNIFYALTNILISMSMMLPRTILKHIFLQQLIANKPARCMYVQNSRLNWLGALADHSLMVFTVLFM